jgi:transcriptional regulator of acetoin/glycerol metabolism
MRPLVADSWRRSVATGVNPGSDGAPSSVATLRAATLRDEHPLAPALPVIRRLLVADAVDSGVMVAVFGADGTLLWVEGDRDARRVAETMNFVPGTDWSEHSAGTSAPGTSLALDREIRIDGREHFCEVAQRWSCSAVPVHDPATGALIGTIDITGGNQAATPTAMAWVRAAVAAVESHLALLRLRPTPVDRGEAPRLTVLGAQRARWDVVDANGQLRSATLTRRHAEILLLLSHHPLGLTTEQLALLLDEKDLDVVTIRAELSRLRRVVGAEFIGSRPYRLLRPVITDFATTLDALARGDARAAVAGYAGPLLPQSVAPSIAALRGELSAGVRNAVIDSGDVGLLRHWLEHPDGRDDRDGWRVLHERAETGSADWVKARGHLAGIDFELG